MMSKIKRMATPAVLALAMLVAFMIVSNGTGAMSHVAAANDAPPSAISFHVDEASGPYCYNGFLGYYNDFGQWQYYGPPVQPCYIVQQPVYQPPVVQQYYYVPQNFVYLTLPNGDNCWYRDHNGNPYDNCFNVQYYWNAAANCWAMNHDNNPYNNCYGNGYLPYNAQQVHRVGQHGRRY